MLATLIGSAAKLRELSTVLAENAAAVAADVFKRFLRAIFIFRSLASFHDGVAALEVSLFYFSSNTGPNTAGAAASGGKMLDNPELESVRLGKIDVGMQVAGQHA